MLMIAAAAAALGLASGGCWVPGTPEPSYADIEPVYDDEPIYEGETLYEDAEPANESEVPIEGDDQAEASDDVTFDEAPALVSIDPNVYVVQDYQWPVYYVDGAYWLYGLGSWYQAFHWYDPWVPIGVGYVPSRIVHRDHHHYKHYHGDRHARVWREPHRQRDRSRDGHVRTHRGRAYDASLWEGTRARRADRDPDRVGSESRFTRDSRRIGSRAGVSPRMRSSTSDASIDRRPRARIQTTQRIGPTTAAQRDARTRAYSAPRSTVQRHAPRAYSMPRSTVQRHAPRAYSAPRMMRHSAPRAMAPRHSSPRAMAPRHSAPRAMRHSAPRGRSR